MATTWRELRPAPGEEPVRLGTAVDPARPNRRTVRINGAEASAVTLGEWLSLSWLTPAMDGLFTDSAGARRRWLDRLAVALDAAHARHASRYEAALRERNRLLAGETAPDPLWLDGIEAQMARGIAMQDGAGRDHFSEQEAMTGQKAMQISAMPVGPVDHGRYGKAAGGFEGNLGAALQSGHLCGSSIIRKRLQ